jgi:hypothetical protein
MIEITLKITDQFSKELDTLVKDFGELGIKTTREDLAIKFMMVGNLNELRERGKRNYAVEE